MFRCGEPGLLAVSLLSDSRDGGGFSPNAGGLTPDEAVKRMVLPDGFHAEVFAAEPMIRQPVTASFDDRAGYGSSSISSTPTRPDSRR